FHAAEHDVVAAVVLFLHVRDHAAASDRINRRIAFVGRVPTGTQQHHADHPVAVECIRNHLPVPRFEDVQGKKHVGEEDDVRQRKQREKVGHQTSGFNGSFSSSCPCSPSARTARVCTAS